SQPLAGIGVYARELQARSPGATGAADRRVGAASPSQTPTRVPLLAAPVQVPGKPAVDGDSRVVSAICACVRDLHRRLRDRPEGLGGPETGRAAAHRAGAARVRRADEMAAHALRSPREFPVGSAGKDLRALRKPRVLA